MSKHSPAEGKIHIGKSVRPLNPDARHKPNIETDRPKGVSKSASTAPPKGTNANNQYR